MKDPIIDSKGNKYWHNDKTLLHRLDGPAEEFASGERYWWIEDVGYTEKDFKEEVPLYLKETLRKAVKILAPLGVYLKDTNQKGCRLMAHDDAMNEIDFMVRYMR